MKSIDLNGALLINKPAGISSAKAVSRVKRQFNLNKVGHCGTLDPFADGLLVILCGKATRLQELFLEGSKRYSGLIRLGTQTNSDDVTGEILNRDSEFRLPDDDAMLHELLQKLETHFSGPQQQTPPQISAIKVDGTRSYKRARRGELVELKPRNVEVFSLKLQSVNEKLLSYGMHCSKGTYVRSFARDLGARLGTFACVETLRRTFSEPFSLDDAVSIEELESSSELAPYLISMEKLVSDLPKLRIDDSQWVQLCLGNQRALSTLSLEAPLASIFSNSGEFKGLIENRGSWQVRFLNIE